MWIETYPSHIPQWFTAVNVCVLGSRLDLFLSGFPVMYRMRAMKRAIFANGFQLIFSWPFSGSGLCSGSVVEALDPSARVVLLAPSPTHPGEPDRIHPG